MPGYPIELHHPAFGIAPETLNAIDVNRASGKFIVAMVYTQVLVKADINEAIVASPAICMNDAGNVGFASNDGLQSAFGRVRHDFGVDAVAAFE